MPDKQENNRNPDGTFKKGQSGNPKGRPEGKTLKEFAREYLLAMSETQKTKFLKKLPPETLWKMAEGNPDQGTDLTTKGEKVMYIPSELLDKHGVSPGPKDNS